MANLIEDREIAVKAAEAIVALAADEARDLTDEETSELEAKAAEIEALDAKIDAAEAAKSKLAALGKREAPVKKDALAVTVVEEKGAATIGEHFVKHAGASLKAQRNGEKLTASAPAFIKAASDTQDRDSASQPWRTTLVAGVQEAYRRPLVTDLFSTSTLSGTHVSYLVEGAIEGSATPVAEAGLKPQVHVSDPTVVTETLIKLAAFIKFTDEMLEDEEFVVSNINGQLLRNLLEVEETQVLNGSGTSGNLAGLLGRVSQTEAAVAAADPGDDDADAIFRAITKIQLNSGMSPDAILINPADYQRLRLSKDANGQYLAGGFFQGQYGNGGILENPPLWGLRTVVSAAQAAGSATVGNFKSASVLRKGGIRVESTNSNEDDFTYNLVTVRAEERLGLMVPRPLAFCKVTFDAVVGA